MIKSLVLAAATTAGVLGAGSAHAGVSWSIGINTPVVGTVVSGGPAYYGPGYGYGRVYAPAPVYRVAPPVAYYPVPAYSAAYSTAYPVTYSAPYPVYYRPVPVVYPRYYPAWRHGHGHWDGRYGHR
jgi:hypothetical protein